MNDIEKAQKLVEHAEENATIAKEASLAAENYLWEVKELLEKAQKPKIQLEHMGVYRLENGEIRYVSARGVGSELVLRPFSTSSRNEAYNKDGTLASNSNGESPVVEHIGKIAIVTTDWHFSGNYKCQDPLNLNNK